MVYKSKYMKHSPSKALFCPPFPLMCDGSGVEQPLQRAQWGGMPWGEGSAGNTRQREVLKHMQITCSFLLLFVSLLDFCLFVSFCSVGKVSVKKLGLTTGNAMTWKSGMGNSAHGC